MKALEYLNRRHFIEILLLLNESPKSFNDLLKILNAYPDTLSRRLNEMQKLDLIVRIEEEGKIKYTLSKRGERLIPLLKRVLDIIERMEEIIEK